jgi:hypothetical protein
MTKEQAVLKKLLDTIVASGGLIRYHDGSYGCAADEEWLDLADTALLAQNVLQISGIVVEIPIANASEAELLPSDFLLEGSELSFVRGPSKRTQQTSDDNPAAQLGVFHSLGKRCTASPRQSARRITLAHRKVPMRLRSNEPCPIHRSLLCNGREHVRKERTVRFGVQRIEDPRVGTSRTMIFSFCSPTVFSHDRHIFRASCCVGGEMQEVQLHDHLPCRKRDCYGKHWPNDEERHQVHTAYPRMGKRWGRYDR